MILLTKYARRFKAQLMFRLEDLWIGAKWEEGANYFEVEMCLIPTLPLRLTWWKKCNTIGAMLSTKFTDTMFEHAQQQARRHGLVEHYKADERTTTEGFDDLFIPHDLDTFDRPRD